MNQHENIGINPSSEQIEPHYSQSPFQSKRLIRAALLIAVLLPVTSRVAIATLYDFPSFTVTTNDYEDVHSVGSNYGAVEGGYFAFVPPDNQLYLPFNYQFNATFDAKPGWKFDSVQVSVAHATISSSITGGGQIDGTITVAGLVPVYWGLARGFNGHGLDPSSVSLSGVPYNFSQWPNLPDPSPFTGGWSGPFNGPTHALDTTSFSAEIDIDGFAGWTGAGPQLYGGGTNFRVALSQAPLPEPSGFVWPLGLGAAILLPRRRPAPIARPA